MYCINGSCGDRGAPARRYHSGRGIVQSVPQDRGQNGGQARRKRWTTGRTYKTNFACCRSRMLRYWLFQRGHAFGIRREYTDATVPMSVSTRRTFLKTAGACLSASSVLAQTAGTAAAITNTELGDKLFLLGGAGANVVAQTGSDGVVLVDGGLASNAAALAQAVAALPGGGPVRTLFNTHWHPEQTGSNEKLGTAGRHDYRPREHAALAAAKHHVAVERTEIQEASEDRPTQQDLLRQRRSRFRNPLRIHLRRGAHRRRSLRLLPAAERACGGRRRLRTRLAGGGLVDRRLDWRHCRRTATHPERCEQGYEDRSRAGSGAQLCRHQPRSSTCTARSTIG